MVQDQRTISWTQMAILEMPQNGSLSTFSCNLYHEELIFFTFHAKSGHRKIFKKLSIPGVPKKTPVKFKLFWLTRSSSDNFDNSYATSHAYYASIGG